MNANDLNMPVVIGTSCVITGIMLLVACVLLNRIMSQPAPGPRPYEDVEDETDTDEDAEHPRASWAVPAMEPGLARDYWSVTPMDPPAAAGAGSLHLRAIPEIPQRIPGNGRHRKPTSGLG